MSKLIGNFSSQLQPLSRKSWIVWLLIFTFFTFSYCPQRFGVRGVKNVKNYNSLQCVFSNTMRNYKVSGTRLWLTHIQFLQGEVRHHLPRHGIFRRVPTVPPCYSRRGGVSVHARRACQRTAVWNTVVMCSAVGIMAAVMGTNAAVVSIPVDCTGGWMMALAARMASKAIVGRHGAGGELVWPRVQWKGSIPLGKQTTKLVLISKWAKLKIYLMRKSQRSK